MAQNYVASAVSLAKTMRMALDRSRENTSVPTATLDLLLNTFIGYVEGENPAGRNIQAQQAAFVAGRITGVEK